MVSLAPPSREQLLRRRQLLRQERRRRFWQGSWRLASSTAFLLLLVQSLQRPYWQIRRPEQIQVSGNHWVDPDWIRGQLPLTYPINIWQVQPAALEKALLGSPASPFQSVQVRRRLLPVGVVVQVQERQLIARARRGDQTGWVDREGNWLPPDPYRFLESLPELEVLSWESHPPEQWAPLLEALHLSEVPIRAVDWHAGGGITLHTELGNVYLGPLSDRLSLQIQILNQMRDLGRYCECTPEEILQIDLSSPTVPTLQLTPAAMQRRQKDLEQR